MEKEIRWYYREDNEVHGPFTLAEIRRSVKVLLQPETMMRQNDGEWLRADRIKETRALFNSPADVRTIAAYDRLVDHGEVDDISADEIVGKDYRVPIAIAVGLALLIIVIRWLL